MQKKAIYYILIFLLIGIKGYAQTGYVLKAEAGYLLWGYNMIRVDAGPGWKGYKLNGENGMDVSVINGLHYKINFTEALD